MKMHIFGRATALAIVPIIIGLLASAAVFSEQEDSVESDAASEQVETADSSATEGRQPSTRRSPNLTFDPSEDVSEDLAVAFPADI